MMNKRFLIVPVLAFLSGCKQTQGTFDGHTIGETFAQFVALEHPATKIPDGVAFTGRVKCFADDDLGDKCNGKLKELSKAPASNTNVPFDNGYFTFVNDKLISIESVGDGGIIGDIHQNWNWNLYLSDLTRKNGKPDKQTATDALWLRRGYVIHAYLTFDPMPYSNGQAQNEHVIFEDRDVYDQENK